MKHQLHLFFILCNLLIFQCKGGFYCIENRTGGPLRALAVHFRDSNDASSVVEYPNILADKAIIMDCSPNIPHWLEIFTIYKYTDAHSLAVSCFSHAQLFFLEEKHANFFVIASKKTDSNSDEFKEFSVQKLTLLNNSFIQDKVHKNKNFTDVLLVTQK